jgi:class 3 adenylate cyclase/predicted ATPase
MTFDEILEQVIALLKRQGRVSYSALKRRFDLDDAYLDDLKDELLFTYPVSDEGGRGLVWSAAQEQPSPQDELLPTAPPPAEAERRQLTVMFCDLVSSTQLSSQLDPEDYRDVVRAYQATCTEVIHHYDGHIAQLLGDGLLVYFGYPQAHEDDASRAVRTGLEIIDAVRALNTRLEQDKGIRLAVRLGIHTGLVVIGEMGGGGRQEQLALGETPNIAARIQGIAAPDSVVISAATHRLVQGYFAYQALGEQTLRGVSQSIPVYRVLHQSGVQSRLDVASTRGLIPLVGRESEVTLLLERWEQVKNGHGQVVLLSGEPGIGKSRLVEILKDAVASEPYTLCECRSSPYFQHTWLYPLIELLERTLAFDRGDSLDTKLQKLERLLRRYQLDLATAVPLFAVPLSLPLPETRYAPLTMTPQQQKQQTLSAILALFLELAVHQPLLFILEDLHWTDPTTLELLDLFIDHTPAASMFLLLTCRPTFQPSWHHRSYLTEVTVNRLSRHQIERVAAHVAGGKQLPREVLHQIVEKTDGVPLFVEEITKAVLESGVLKEHAGHYQLTGPVSALAIPATLHDSLMARLDRLGTAKAVAQYAAVIGRHFSYELLHAVSPLDEAMLQHELGRLVEAELLYPRGLPPQATYLFKHALIRDASYETLLKNTRQQYHQRIAQALEAQFPETAATQPELVAYHCMEAGLTAQSVSYWHTAAQRAIERSAHVEAISHLRTGLALLQTLPETSEHTRREVDMLLALGVSLNATKSIAAPEVEQTYLRAQHLCQHLEEPQQLFPVLRGLWNYYNIRAELQTAHALGEQLLNLAQQVQDSGMLLAAHRAVGTTLFWMGAVAAAQSHFTQGIALYDPKQHRASAFLYGEDAGVVCQSLAAWTLWCLGFPHQGLTRSHEAVTLAQQSAYPFSVAFALGLSATCHALRREVCLTQERAEAVISLAKDQGFPYWMAVGALMCGWASTHQGQGKAGIKQMTQGLRAYRATGAVALQPYFLALLAEAHGTLGQAEAGLTVLTEALTRVDTTGERWYESEIYRLQGELLLQQTVDNQVKAESCFRHALDLARSQQAKSLELRTATSLARLWQHQGKRPEARQVLGDVYGWFTEGFDTADLKEARALLDALQA